MKVKFYYDNGKGVRSSREEIIDTVTDLGLEEGAWQRLCDEEKQEYVKAWVLDNMWFGWGDVNES